MRQSGRMDGWIVRQGKQESKREYRDGQKDKEDMEGGRERTKTEEEKKVRKKNPNQTQIGKGRRVRDRVDSKVK